MACMVGIPLAGILLAGTLERVWNASRLHNTNLRLLRVPHAPFHINTFERAILFESGNRCIDLRQENLSIRIALVETTYVHIGVQWFADWPQSSVRFTTRASP